MEKPVTKQSSDNILYYLKLCEAKADSPDTIVNKAAGLEKFNAWCATQGVYDIDKIDLDLMDDYMLYLNQYRKPLCVFVKAKVTVNVSCLSAHAAVNGLRFI